MKDELRYKFLHLHEQDICQAGQNFDGRKILSFFKKMNNNLEFKKEQADVEIEAL